MSRVLSAVNDLESRLEVAVLLRPEEVVSFGRRVVVPRDVVQVAHRVAAPDADERDDSRDRPLKDAVRADPHGDL